MSFNIPSHVRKHLLTLYPTHRLVENSMAACTLHAWNTHFDQPTGGISAPLSLAAKITHFDADPEISIQKAYSPVFVWRSGEMMALLFSDQTGLVAQVHGARVIALPAVFRLHKEGPTGTSPALVIRSKRKPEAEISFRFRPRGIHLPSYDAMNPDIRSAAGAAALEYLEADLAILAALFADLPRVVQPMDDVPATIPGTVSLPFLPQRWFSDSDVAAGETWARDMADWIKLHRPDYRNVSVTISARPPNKAGEPYALIEPFHYHCMAPSRPGGGDISTTGNVKTLFADPGRMVPPVPAEKLYNLHFELDGKRAHRCHSPVLAVAHACDQISKHRQLEIQARFGTAVPQVA